MNASVPEHIYDVASCFHHLYWVLYLLVVLTHKMGENFLRASECAYRQEFAGNALPIEHVSPCEVPPRSDNLHVCPRDTGK